MSEAIAPVDFSKSNTGISSDYGLRKDLKDPSSNIQKFHHGIDIATQEAATQNINIRSMQTGIVVYNGTSGTVGLGVPNSGSGYGNVVVVKNLDGTGYLYAHLKSDSSNYFQKGDLLNQGDTLGYMGATGSSTGYHVHIEKLTEEAIADIETYGTGTALGLATESDRAAEGKSSYRMDFTSELQAAMVNDIGLSISEMSWDIGIELIGDGLSEADGFQTFEDIYNDHFNTDTSFQVNEISLQNEQGVDIQTYTIKPGDSVAKIAEQYGTTVEVITGAEGNDWLGERTSEDGSFILVHPGEELVIPNASIDKSLKVIGEDGSQTIYNYEDGLVTNYDPDTGWTYSDWNLTLPDILTTSFEDEFSTDFGFDNSAWDGLSLLDNSLLDFESEISPTSNNAGINPDAWQQGSAMHGGDYSANMPIDVINGGGLTNEQLSKNITDDWQPGDMRRVA